MKNFLYLLFIFSFPFSLHADDCPDVDFRCDSGHFPIHLTFDDGPARQTPNILSILDEQDVKATFFLQGEKLVSPDGKKIKSQASFNLMNKMLADGHIVGSHTYHHIRHLDEATGNSRYKIDRDMLSKSHLNWMTNIDVQKKSPLLKKYMINQGKQYMRLPYGQGWFKANRGPMPDPVVLKYMLDPEGQKSSPVHVGWNISPDDWTNPTPHKYLTSLRDQICDRRGGIVLLHDHTRSTNQNLQCFIRLAKDAGHEFVDRPDSLANYRDGASGPKIVMEYKDIPNIHLPPEKNCEDEENRGDLARLDDDATMIMAHLRNSSDYTPYDEQVQ